MMGFEGLGGMMGGAMMGGGLMMILVWLVPVALVVWGMGSLRGGQLPRAQDETPLEILRRRYASGDINKDEFEQARHDLA
jgi:putative membrane protein